MTEITFNKKARQERVATQFNAAVEKIRKNWEEGISPVDLEVDTDIYNEILSILKKDVSGLGTTYVTSKGLSQRKKNNKTIFRVINTTL